MTGRYCTNCLYDLVATRDPRCPECGRAFDLQKPESSTLASRSIALWAFHHVRIALNDWAHHRRERMYCRECFTDLLPHRRDSKCPICDTWFEEKEEWTYRRSDHAMARVYERFRHVCIWRGAVFAGLLLVFGIGCVISGTALLPGAGRMSAGQALLRLEGLPAIMMGIAWLGGALALHARYFWGRIEPVWRIADVGVIAGVVMIVAGWGYALYRAISDIS